jgi:hypothetical protein
MKLNTLSPILLLTSLGNAQNVRPRNHPIEHLAKNNDRDESITSHTSRDKLTHWISSATPNQLYLSSQDKLPSNIARAFKSQDASSVINRVEQVLQGSDSSDKKLKQLLGTRNGETLFRSAVNNKDLDSVNIILKKIIQSKNFDEKQLDTILDEVQPHCRRMVDAFSRKTILAEVFDPDKNLEVLTGMVKFTASAAVLGYVNYQLLFRVGM